MLERLKCGQMFGMGIASRENKVQNNELVS